MLRRLLLWIAIAMICVGCNFPRDPEHTLERVSAGTMRVGVVENEPWVKRVNGQSAGVEVILVRQFANSLGTKIDWVWGSDEDHLEALKHHELDLAIGGLTKSTPWKKEIGLTNPYFTDRITVGVPRSIPPIHKLKGVSVATKRDKELVEAYLKEKKAIPIRVDDLFAMNGPVAASSWQLEQQGFAVTDIELHKDKHVIAVPPGENGWLKLLDNFLRGYRSQIKQMLQQEARS